MLTELIGRKTARQTASANVGLIVDNFAGAGGASLGIEAALGRCVDIAINHSRKAVEAHSVNHPHTRHLCEDVWDVDPLEVTGGRPVDLVWLSPDCKHFSKAKGGKPLSKKIRGLAWVTIRWAKDVKPNVIILENVEEFQTWGPLDRDGKPIKEKAGQTFLRWISALRNCGYEVEHRELIAADYGVPTTRKRFFLVARRDGKPIVWPKRTHAPRHKAEALGLLPYKSAAECIDFSLPILSIFERKRPLAEATNQRIYKGMMKHVIESADPFVICCNHAGEHGLVWSSFEPLRTITASRDAVGVVVPHLSKYFTGVVGADAREPMPTVTAIDHNALVAPTIVPIAHFNGSNTSHKADDPLRTVTAYPKGGHFALVEAFLTKYHGERAGEIDGRSADARLPVRTIDTQNRHALVSATIQRFKHGEATHVDPRTPMQTICAGGNNHAVLAATLMTNTSGHGPGDITNPVPTLTSGNQQAVISATLVGAGGPTYAAKPTAVTEPMGTLTTENHRCLAEASIERYGEQNRIDRYMRKDAPGVYSGADHTSEVRAFIVKYYSSGSQNQSLKSPMHTLTAKARLGLVTIHGEDWQIVDIGLRMLEPRELLKAQFGRFADEYVLWGSKADQVAAIGNSVCPELAEALVKAQFPEGLA